MFKAIVLQKIEGFTLTKQKEKDKFCRDLGESIHKLIMFTCSFSCSGVRLALNVSLCLSLWFFKLT